MDILIVFCFGLLFFEWHGSEHFYTYILMDIGHFGGGLIVAHCNFDLYFFDD